MTSINQDEAFLRGDWNMTDKVLQGGGLVKPITSFVLGRFEPIHEGHIDLIKAAASVGTKTVILVGSATESRGLDNPFTFEERKVLIEQCFPDLMAEGKLVVVPVRDMKYRDAAWEKHVTGIIKNMTGEGRVPVVFGMEKDTETTDCLGIFRKHLEVRISPQTRVLNATDIRNEFFAGTTIDDTHFGPDVIPEHVKQFLIAFEETAEYARLVVERDAVLEQQRKNEEIKRINGFYPIYVAVDTLAVWKDYWGKPHLLVITRKGEIGKGKWALPGGYLNYDETIRTAVVRENVEEAGNDLSAFTFNEVKVIDAVKRSKRGRMITHVHHCWTQSAKPPKITAGDDAETVQWVPFDELYGMQEKFFADHYHIIAKMLPVVEEFGND
jgi:bifunctional NMN adenylyltransferase/nudix hydrolase